MIVILHAIYGRSTAELIRVPDGEEWVHLVLGRAAVGAKRFVLIS